MLNNAPLNEMKPEAGAILKFGEVLRLTIECIDRSTPRR
jgi:hypothetical protein